MMEGMYSLSQLLGLVNHSFFNRDMRHNQPVVQTLSLITSIVSNIEVFAEGVGHAFCTTAQRNLLVLIIEATKATCRLLTLLTSSSHTMLLNWGKNDTGGNAAAVDINHYIAHYKTACGRLLNNLHAKQPEIFRLFASPSRPPSLRMAQGTAAGNLTVVSAAMTTAAEGAAVGMNLGGAGSATGGSSKPVPEQERASHQGRRSGIQFNSEVFAALAAAAPGAIIPPPSATAQQPLPPAPMPQQRYGQRYEHSPVARSAPLTGSSMHSMHTTASSSGVNSDGFRLVSPPSSGAASGPQSAQNSSHGGGDEDILTTPYHGGAGISHQALRHRRHDHSSELLHSGQPVSRSESGSASGSGRSSPEFKDNEPGSIYGPGARVTLPVPHTGTPYNRGYQLHAHLDDTAEHGQDSHCNSGAENDSSYGIGTAYVPATIYAPSEDSTPLATPYRGGYSSASPYADPSTTSMSASYSHSANHSTISGNHPSELKHRLDFEPDGEEHTGPSCNTADTSFDCEMVFTSIYGNSPQKYGLSTAAAANAIPILNRAIQQQVDEEVFVGENEHFKSTALEPKSLRISPDAAWAGQKRPAFVYDPSNEGADDTPGLLGAPMSGYGGGSGGSGGSYMGALKDRVVSAFELGAEDALKLGEMLYILRPLIYAALLQQIEAYRAKQNADGSGQNTTSTSGADHSNTVSSGTAASGSTGSAGYSGAFRRVLDALTMDVLLGVVALAISFATELVSIQLTQYALTTLRNRARDDIFTTQVAQYLVLGHGAAVTGNTTVSVGSTGSWPTTVAAVAGEERTLCGHSGATSPASTGTSGGRSRGQGHMAQYATLRKRVHDVFSAEHQGLPQRHAFDQELHRRKMALFLYLIRSPVFDRATYPMLKTVSGVAKSIPLVGSLPEYALSVLSYLNKMHFYNANS